MVGILVIVFYWKLLENFPKGMRTFTSVYLEEYVTSVFSYCTVCFCLWSLQIRWQLHISANAYIFVCRDAIVTWIKKKIGPAVQNVTTTEEAEKILTAENTLVLGFFDSLVVILAFLFKFTLNTWHCFSKLFIQISDFIVNMNHLCSSYKSSLILFKLKTSSLVIFSSSFQEELTKFEKFFIFWT